MFVRNFPAEHLTGASEWTARSDERYLSVAKCRSRRTPLRRRFLLRLRRRCATGRSCLLGEFFENSEVLEASFVTRDLVDARRPDPQQIEGSVEKRPERIGVPDMRVLVAVAELSQPLADGVYPAENVARMVQRHDVEIMEGRDLRHFGAILAQ